MKRLVVVALVLAACTSEAIPAFSPSPTASAAKTPVARTAAESTECVRSVLSSLIDAFNRGDSGQLATFFSATQGAMAFQWFVTPETPPYGPGISQLPDYFATWRAAGERWRLVSVEAGASPGGQGGVDFAMNRAQLA